MFKYTDWPKFIKLGIIGIFTLVTLIEGVGTWAPPILLTSVVIAIMGIYQIVRNKNKKQSIGLITLGIILFSFSNLHIAAQEAEQTRIEQQEVEAQAEKERLAEEKKQQEIARKKEQERIEAEKKLKEKLIEAIEKAEDEPTKSNYDKAISLLDQLNDKDERLVERLEKIKPTVDAYEEELKLAKEAIEKAEENLNRETYNEAYKLVVTLSVPNSRLDRQLEALDQEITKIEEEKLAKEKEEAERIAAEKAEAERVEAERVAAEKAAQEKERQQATAESESQSNNSQASASVASTPAPGEYVDAYGNGLIKGSSSGIYHVPGSTYYDRTTNPVRMFKTIAEAEAAGYRAPKR